MELVLIGVLGQVLALRFLVVQAARSPEDPPLFGQAPVTGEDLARRAARRPRLVFWGIVAFASASAVTVIGLILLVAA
ncbi:MAG: hypothetical protein H0V93_15605 [Euzebyales bacterium]|nr:hypothetical protein [Euzebyales bacterium]